MQLNDETALNFRDGERLVGIEVLDASEILGASGVPSVLLENIAHQAACRWQRHTPGLSRSRIS
ncbi:MAG: DUF2283 domain-containing protein [Candidatus Sumerlaeaceae bacterium]